MNFIDVFLSNIIVHWMLKVTGMASVLLNFALSDWYRHPVSSSQQSDAKL